MLPGGWKAARCAFDVNHSGIVDWVDVLLIGPPGDADEDANEDGENDGENDGDLDLRDFAALQSCFAGPATALGDPSCALVDLDADDDVDNVDVRRWIALITGPDQ